MSTDLPTETFLLTAEERGGAWGITGEAGKFLGLTDYSSKTGDQRSFLGTLECPCLQKLVKKSFLLNGFQIHMNVIFSSSILRADFLLPGLILVKCVFHKPTYLPLSASILTK
jgi:hypothetical protein